MCTIITDKVKVVFFCCDFFFQSSESSDLKVCSVTGIFGGPNFLFSSRSHRSIIWIWLSNFYNQWLERVTHSWRKKYIYSPSIF